MGSEMCIRDRYSRVEVTNWKVIPDLNNIFTDHLSITYQLNDPNMEIYVPKKKITDLELLREQLTNLPVINEYNAPEEVVTNAETITKWLSKCVETATTERPAESRIYWWNNILEDFQVRLKKLNRRIYHCRDVKKREELRKGKLTMN